MQSTYSLQEPFIREVNDCPESLSKLYPLSLIITENLTLFHSESLLELIIAKDSLKSNSPSIESILSHSFFKEFAPTFDQVYSESLVASKLSFDVASKDFIAKASQKTEQRLKDEQKLVSAGRKHRIRY